MPFLLNMLFFVKSQIEKCFGCHGDMNLDNLFVNFILVLIISFWLHNMCIDNQLVPLFKGDSLL